MAERKVRLYVKLFDFFMGEYSSVWLEICRVLSQIQWIFLRGISGKTILGNFFRNFVQTKTILYQNLWNSTLLSAIFFRIRIVLKKFTLVLSYVVCTQLRRHTLKKVTKRRYEVEKTGRFVFGKPVLFTLDLGLTTPYSLGSLVSNFYQTFVTTSTEFWLRFEPQIRTTRLTINFLFITARAERKVCFCVKVFNFFRGWVLIRLTWNLPRFVPNSVEILTSNFNKKLFRENFSEILCKPRLSVLYQNLWNFALLSEILFWIRIALKKFKRVLSYIVCTQVRRHIHKKITKRRYGGENPGHFVFGKPVGFTLGLGHTTPYSFSILVWNFYQRFVTVSTEF